jgi:hypothetical protein
MEVSGQLHAPAALPPGKRPWYPLDRRLGGPQSRSGRGGEEKNSQPPPESNPDLSIVKKRRKHWSLNLSLTYIYMDDVDNHTPTLH